MRCCLRGLRENFSTDLPMSAWPFTPNDENELERREVWERSRPERGMTTVETELGLEGMVVPRIGSQLDLLSNISQRCHPFPTSVKGEQDD